MNQVLAFVQGGRADAARAAAWARRAFADPNSLLRRATTSLGWTVVAQGTQMVTRLGSNLILTWMLAPEAFGVMAAILMFHTALELVTDIGVKPAVVSNRFGSAPAFLRTAWTIKLGIQAAIAAVLLLVAVGLSALQSSVDLGQTIYADPDFPGLFAFAALLPLLTGLEPATVWLAMRKLVIQRVAKVQLLGNLLGATLLVTIVAIEPSAWTLLGGAIASTALRMALMHALIPGPRMRLRLHRRFAGEIWGFGKWLMLSSSFQFLALQGDRLVLSMLLDARSFGIYAVARIWIDAFRKLLMMGNSVVRSSLAELVRKASPNTGTVFNRLIASQTALFALTTLAILVLAPIVYPAVYPPDFAAVAPLLQALSFALLWQSFGTANGLLLAHGDSRTLALELGLQGVVTVTGVYLAYEAFGLTGVLLAVALAPVVRWLVLLSVLPRYLPLPVKAYAGVVALFAVVTVGGILLGDFASALDP